MVFLYGLLLHYPIALAVDSIPIDIYGTDTITVEEIRSAFAKELSELTDMVTRPDFFRNLENSSTYKKQWHSLKKKISDGIKNKGDFLFVDVSCIRYFHKDKKDTHYITIDIVEQKDKHRLAYFLPEPTGTIPDPDGLLKQWSEYESKKTAIDYSHIVYFNHPQLKRYEAIFDELVPKNKAQLLEILKNDKSYKKRENIPLLLVHIKNDKELVKLLTPFIRDSNDAVRNSVIMIIGWVLAKDNTIDFPVDEAITALDFPGFDRNQALFILNSLADRENLAPYIAQHAGKQLIDCLKMLQPNHHNPAHDILKKISGQKYGDRDYEAWQRWLDTVRKTPAME